MATETQTSTASSTFLSESFPNIAPFPNDIPTAPLLRLSLARLRSDPAESQRFYTACKDLGFFYLDLRDDDVGQQVLDEADQLFELSKKLFNLGRDALQPFDYSSKGSYYGYKGFGDGVVDAKGTKDTNEFYNSPKDDFLGISKSPYAHPQLLNDHKPLLASYMQNAHSIIELVLTQLNEYLDLPADTLAKLHAQTSVSGDHVRMIKAPPQPPSCRDPSMGAHTDFGSVTVLMNRVGGLQVLLPTSGDDEWTYVRPLPGHCIVNLGDAMVKFSNGLLRSNIHRVVAPPGLQSDETRYSLVYFCRPADHVLLKRLESDVIPPLQAGVVEEDVCSKDWIRDKAMARRTVGFKAGGMPSSRETGRLAQSAS